jgi:hypothetical protein
MRRAVLIALAAGSILATPGCVQRRMTIRSNPPGALVYVDDYQIGTTPISHDFVYYGTRKIRLVKDGYETLTVRQPFPTPWYEYFPLDFVTENVIPWEVRDERVVELAMQPATPAAPEMVVARAEQVRLAAGSQPAALPQAVPQPAPQPVVPPQLPPPQSIPAPPPSLPPPGFGPAQPLPAPAQQPLVLPPQEWSQGIQPPRQNAPAQGIPSLGMP